VLRSQAPARGADRIEDLARAQCHALASGNRNGHWFGAGNSKRAAESFATGFCSN
jgi:hypothetical protein